MREFWVTIGVMVLGYIMNLGIRPMKNINRRLLPHITLVILGILSCQGHEPTIDQENRQPFTHERRAALAMDAWGGMRVDWTTVADWPTGDTPAAKAVRTWIEKWLRPYRGEPFNGDLADWDAMTHFHGRRFLVDNGQKKIEADWRSHNNEEENLRTGKPDIKPGADVFLDDNPTWFCRHSAIIEYEDEHIVSYRAGFYGYFVGNVTSAAYIKCATFRKSNGKILGWDAFSDTNAVYELVRKLVNIQFKTKTDYAGVGIVPVPDAPLFTKDGFWVFWGDYTIVEGHAYEMNDEFPSLFVPWRDPTCGNRLSGKREAVENLLTQEAKIDLGIAKPKPNH